VPFSVEQTRYHPHWRRVQLAKADRGPPQKLSAYAVTRTVTPCRSREEAEDIAAFMRRRAPIHDEHIVVRVIEVTPTRRQRRKGIQNQLMDLAVQTPPNGRRVDKRPIRFTKYRPPKEEKRPDPEEGAGRSS
jgi:hypothetical protein